MIKYVVSVGGGLSSTLFLPWYLIKIAGIARDEIDFVIAALPNEHPDVWRLIEAVEKEFGIVIKRIGSGKGVWDVFHEQHFIGNSLYDNCSKTLKRDVMREYMLTTYPGQPVTLVLGIGAHEIDRELNIRLNWKKAGYATWFPLIDYPGLTSEKMQEYCYALFGFVPELYTLGYSHNNCGGACVKAGKNNGSCC